MNEFLSWDILSTYAGAALATGIIVQFLKGVIDKAVKLPTQLLSYGVALVLLYAASFFTGGLDGSTAALIPINAVLVSLASNGGYEAVARLASGAKDHED